MHGNTTRFNHSIYSEVAFICANLLNERAACFGILFNRMTQQLQPRSSKTPDFPRTGGFEACIYGDQSIDTITIGLGKGGEMILWYFELECGVALFLRCNSRKDAQILEFRNDARHLGIAFLLHGYNGDTEASGNQVIIEGDGILKLLGSPGRQGRNFGSMLGRETGWMKMTNGPKLRRHYSKYLLGNHVNHNMQLNVVPTPTPLPN
ncbi:hypothetical protein EYR41_005672 [Orbilia oligospora]|uniref:Uncharacterized protein n=1 Tax=Orbilia oligospora TaxID=2813651 RepID=A0A8H2HRT3_ORBOL|nr:hypothetical protein EYR41_005672 [Orbilia oligospora]